MYEVYIKMKPKVVFITGGSRGIGACAVKMFADEGYNVAFTYLNSEEKARKLATGSTILPIKADCSNSKEIDTAIDLAIKKFGNIDMLINNVGIDEFYLINDISDEMWHKMLDTNLSSAFYASRKVIKGMINQQNGVIINVASMWGEVGASCEVHYSVSKAGLIGLTKALAKEVGPSNIRVNCVSPGVIDTDMNSHLSESDIESLKYDTPLGKIGKCEDVCNMLLYLSSDKASFITGQVFSINGGFVI
jgi:3-oxoacyl-[acyl-carrier protein] reductase